MSAYIFGSVKTKARPNKVIATGSVSATGIVVSNVSGGYYTMVEPGTYTLTATAPGRTSKTWNATVSAGQTLNHDFLLA